MPLSTNLLRPGANVLSLFSLDLWGPTYFVFPSFHSPHASMRRRDRLDLLVLFLHTWYIFFQTSSWKRPGWKRGWRSAGACSSTRRGNHEGRRPTRGEREREQSYLAGEFLFSVSFHSFVPGARFVFPARACSGHSRAWLRWRLLNNEQGAELENEHKLKKFPPRRISLVVFKSWRGFPLAYVYVPE